LGEYSHAEYQQFISEAVPRRNASQLKKQRFYKDSLDKNIMHKPHAMKICAASFAKRS